MLQESVLNTSIQSEPCKHISSCFDCNTIGVSLKIDQHVLESFRVPQSVKQVCYYFVELLFYTEFFLIEFLIF